MNIRAVTRRAAALASILILCAGQTGFSESPSPTGDAVYVNAIPNGDFSRAEIGWSLMGPGYTAARLTGSHLSIVDKEESMLEVNAENAAGYVVVYSPSKIKVTPGREYKFRLAASGRGTFSFGAYEYGEDGNPIRQFSETLTLTETMSTYDFLYRAGADAREILPAILFYPVAEQNNAIAAVLHEFFVPVPEVEFKQVTNWPGWATMTQRFDDYRGLTAEQQEGMARTSRMEGVIVPPYREIVARENGRYELTTSTFEFHASAFPAAVAILGEEVLAAPIALKVAGAEPYETGRLALNADGQRVIAEQTLKYPGFDVTVKGELHYDALMVFEVELRSASDARVDGLELHIPLQAEIAAYGRYVDFVAENMSYGPIPKPGETVEVKATLGRGQLKRANEWRPAATAETQAVLWDRRGHIAYFWLGDEKRGLGYISESAEGCRFDKDDVTFEVLRQEGQITGRVIFVTVPVTLDKPRRIRFAIQATPPKPVAQDWFRKRYGRLWGGSVEQNQFVLDRHAAMLKEPGMPTIAEVSPLDKYASDADMYYNKRHRPPWDNLQQRTSRSIGFLWWDVWSAGCSSPQVKDDNAMRSYLAASRYFGFEALPYFALTHLTLDSEEGFHYGVSNREWAREPLVVSGGTKYPHVKICPNSDEFTAYMAYEIGRLIDEYDIPGVYFDNCYPAACSNARHGCGYVDDQGVRQPTIPFRGSRRQFMLIRNEFVKRGKTPLIMTHAGLYPGVMSFVDAELAGEGTYGSDHTEMVSLGEWRAQWLGHNQLGVQLVYHAQFGYGVDLTHKTRADHEKEGTPTLIAMALMHGTPIFAQYLDTDLMYRCWGAFDLLDEQTVDFIPYWEWPLNQKLHHHHVYTSLYRQSKKAIMVVSNLSPTRQLAHIPLAELRQVFPKFQTAIDPLENDQLTSTPYLAPELPDEFIIDVPAKGFRLVLLE